MPGPLASIQCVRIYSMTVVSQKKTLASCICEQQLEYSALV